jgi:hypothetical protein
VLRDLTDAPDDAVAGERARVAVEGWGARLLALQAPDGRWGGGAYFPAWTSTAWTLMLLRHLGLDPASERARRAVALVREHCRWECDDLPFFDGELEPCINGMAVAIGAYFGQDVRGIVDRLLGEQMRDGGWNCEQDRGSTRGSFCTTICVLEGLLEYERATGGTPEVAAAARRGQAYLLDRRLLRRLSTGEVINQAWTRFSFPTYHYDVLRALDYLRSAGVAPDERVSEAIGLVEQKRGGDGRWLLENPHAGGEYLLEQYVAAPQPGDRVLGEFDGLYRVRRPGQVHFDLDEGEGKPSRWNTLRALRVLRWYERAES